CEQDSPINLCLYMKKLLLLFLTLAISHTSFTQEIVRVEEQSVALSFILEIALPISVEYDVLNYKITYTTTDAFGQPDTVTGLLSLPNQSDFVLPLAVYNHGTVGARDEVPSVEGVLERLLIQGVAGNRFIVLAPDYLGLGDSDGIHPYLHAETQASAGRDMVIAVKKWLDEQNIRENGQLFVTGYSQGGHASMALARDLEQNPGDDGLTLSAAAHLSGPYDITPPSAGILGLRDLDPRTISFFLNTIISYDFVYDLYGGADSLFKEPYLAEVQRFLDEEVDLYEMGEILDTMLENRNALFGELFTDQVVTDVLDADPDLLAAYNDNDVFDWTPVAPTLLYYCNGDQTVNPTTAIVTDSIMRMNGADSLLLEDGGPLDHVPCATPAALRALAFFQGLSNVFSVSLGEVSERPEIGLAPNPVAAGGQLRFSGLPNEVHPFLIYDQSGRQILSGNTQMNGAIDLPRSLPRGLTVIRIGLADGNSVVRRVMVK
ncbi:MAG: alpha/beta fold hydrolase, partial [Bacteroidota bacterium]